MMFVKFLLKKSKIIFTYENVYVMIFLLMLTISLRKETSDGNEKSNEEKSNKEKSSKVIASL